MTATAARLHTTEDDVLTLIVNHLRSKLGLSESNCQETVAPNVKMTPPGGDYWLGVCADGSEFDSDAQYGGGRNTLWEQLDIVVTAYSRVKLDRMNTDKGLIHDAKRGLVIIKQKILSAMVMADLSADLQSVLAVPPLAVSSGPIEYDAEAMVGWKTIRFRVAYSNALGTENDRA